MFVVQEYLACPCELNKRAYSIENGLLKRHVANTKQKNNTCFKNSKGTCV